MRETDDWPVIRASRFRKGPRRLPVRLIVIHDMEAPEKGDTAEKIAQYFRDMPDGRDASAHICVDNNSTVQCVMDSDIAFGAPGANEDGIQIELAGYGNQSMQQWLDDYGKAMLEIAANDAAQYCLKFDIPPVHLTNAELRLGKPGVIGHYQASEVFHGSDHTDPGPNFPWDYFMGRIKIHWQAMGGA